MLKIRMQRIGRRHQPHYRVVVIDGRRGPKSGKFVEILGHYNAKMGEFKVKEDRASYWISVGAQPSDTVHNFLVDAGVVEGKKVNVLPKKTPIVTEQPEEEKEEVASEVISTENSEAPAEEAPAEEAPAEEAPAEEAPAEEAPAEEAPAEEAPAEEAKPEEA